MVEDGIVMKKAEVAVEILFVFPMMCLDNAKG